MNRIKLITLIAVLTQSASAFCGFYVASADGKVFNKASKVVVARDGEQTVLTMVNDAQTDLAEFAAVFPVPTVLKREDIKTVPMKIVDHLDAYSAPRLVYYNDPNPCQPPAFYSFSAAPSVTTATVTDSIAPPKSAPLRVKIEAQYDVDEYQVLILSAEDSGDLETWLKREGYKIPEGAAHILGSYLRQNMKFFVAKVNLEKQLDLGYTYLRPLQVRYTSKKFGLPIRLGTLNAKGDQELIAFMLNPLGRVECTNYKTERLPTGQEVPAFVKDEFKAFYRDMFYYQVAKAKKKKVFMEYGWDMGWCDPCAADPLTPSEQLTLGCTWLKTQPQSMYRVQRGETLYSIAKAKKVGVATLKQANGLRSNRIVAGSLLTIPGTPIGKARNASTYITRLHMVYNATTFPEDLVFQTTSDRTNFQGRYVIQKPWEGKADQCEAAAEYFKTLETRKAKRAETLVEITGWDLDEVRKKTGVQTTP